MEDTKSVHAGAERNVCIMKVSAETPQSTTNPSEAAPHVQTSTLTPVSPPRLPQHLAQPFAHNKTYSVIAWVTLLILLSGLTKHIQS